MAPETAQVDTTSSTLANLVESKQMVDLPLNGRNFQQLILLAPGVNVAQTSTTSFYGKGDTYSIAGGRPEGAAYLLDGTDITNFFNHGSGAGSLGTLPQWVFDGRPNAFRLRIRTRIRQWLDARPR